MIDLNDYCLDKGFKVYELENYHLRLGPLGKNAVRVIATRKEKLELPSYWLDFKSDENYDFVVTNKTNKISFTNYNLRVDFDGKKLSFYNKERLILDEISLRQSKVRRTVGIDDHIEIPNLPTSSLAIDPYEFIDIGEDITRSRLRFVGDGEEKIYGMGGFQEESLDKNNHFIELMQRNSQTVIPTYISNKNYGFIWNNPSVGSAFFGKNQKVWEASDSDIIDYIVFVGDNPKELIEKLTEITGRPPKMEENLLGLWQSKLRYQTKDELEEVYNQYIARGINPSVMVIDYFHWPFEGDYKFDFDYWQGIDKLSEKMEKNGTKLMVSIWPTVEEDSENFPYLKEYSLLLEGINTVGKVFNDRYVIDFSKEDSREFLAQKLEENYTKNGALLFWADQAEPEMNVYNHFIYEMGGYNMSKLGNLYPNFYLRAVNQVSGDLPVLIRSAFLTSQKYSALLWSGDVESSFRSMRRQIQFATSVGLCGQSWWTSDIGGFHSGNSDSDYFRELLIRWFQISVFSPILRMHGDRQPHFPRIGENGGGLRTSGSPNEIYSFGKDVEEILTSYISLRLSLKEYISYLFDQASERGLPLIRPMFMEYPNESHSYEENNQYFFGPDILVCPAFEYGQRTREVFIPDMNWIDAYSESPIRKGNNLVACPIEKIPVFVNKNSKYFEKIISGFKTIGG